jgi:hypothetical protein
MLHRRTPGSQHERSRWLLCSAFLILLDGCQPTEPGTPLEVYLSRTGAVQSIAPSDEFKVPPVVVDLQLPIPWGTLDTLDLVSLSGCSVQATIGKRNSSLGRHAKPSQRLLLELEYLQLAPPCIDLLRDHNNTLANVLDAAWRQRQKQLPALTFNATLGSDEYRSFWLAPRAPGDYPVVSLAVAVSALQRVNRHVCRWLSGDYQAHNRDFEVSLSEIAGGDAGALLNAHYQNSSGLAVSDSVSERLQSRLTPVKTLETQLASTLPLQYRHWMANRNDRVIKATPDQSHQTHPYSPPPCGINWPFPCPNCGEFVTLDLTL